MKSEWSNQQNSTMGKLSGAIKRNPGQTGVAIAVLLVAIVSLGLNGCSNKSAKSTEPSKPVQSQASATSPAPAVVPAPTPATPPKTTKKAAKKRPSTVSYSDPVSGVSFRYPRKYELKTGADAKPQLPGLGEVPSNFVQPGGASIATVELPDTSFPGTDFAAAFFSVSVNRTLSESECSQFVLASAPESDHRVVSSKVKVGGREFDQLEAVDDETSRQGNARYYHVYEQGACYEFALGLGTEDSVLNGTVTPVDSDTVFQRLEGILASVEIKPQPIPQTATASTGSTPEEIK